jgi:threonylcarbamoyladenosine tRNA methylthiotransferase CDKAL1
MRFYIETYGCTANFGNSLEVEAALMEMGHYPASLAEADIVIVNTCAVTERTERKILRRLRRIQCDRLVIAGCLAAALPGLLQDIKCSKRLCLLGRSTAEEIANLFPRETSDLHYQPRLRHQPHFYDQPHLHDQPRILTDYRPQNLCGIVNIAEGCNGCCSYCIVRRARGRLKSRTPEDVVKDVQEHLKRGAVEVQLAAQDTAAYGIDIGTTLPQLLERIVEIPGRFMVRVGMMNPDTARPILSELSDAFHSPKVYSFLHMPVQSGSDRILKSMNRRYSAEDFLRIVDYLRQSIDDISLITDVISGFPGETEDDFRETMGLLKTMQPDKVNITRYSSRPGTPASTMYDMPDRIKKDRSRELTRLWLEMAACRNISYEGKTLDALVTEQGRGNTMKARTMNYTGIVIEGKPKLGSTIKVKVTGSNAFYLSGRALAR